MHLLVIGFSFLVFEVLLLSKERNSIYGEMDPRMARKSNHVLLHGDDGTMDMNIPRGEKSAT